ncbi:MAG: hypothetical protein ACLSUW_10940 [Akkermansia sp.]
MLPPLPNLRKTTEKRTRWWTQMAGLGLWSLLQPLCMSLNIRSIRRNTTMYTTLFLVAFGTTAPSCRYAFTYAQAA